MDKEKKGTENLDMDMMAEQELSKLQRLYRIMEGDKFAYSGGANGKINRQRKLIGILKNEQKNIIADLNIATSLSKKKHDHTIMAQLEVLMQDYDCITDKVKIEKKNLSEVDNQIKKMVKAIADIKTKTITDLQCQKRIIAGQQKVKSLENKLEVRIKKFNVVVSENFKFRNEINHLLKERAYFNIIWEKLINNLNHGKKFMLDLIEQATLAYDQREEWCTKLHALRTKANQDMLLHTKEIRFLQRKLDHDTKLQEFLGTKGQKRIMKDLEAREQKRKEQSKEKMQKQLNAYNETFKQIKDFCGESDVKKLIAKFIKHEEENFALFNYINELNHESETLSYIVAELRINITAQRELNNQREKQQKDNIENMEAKLKTETTRGEKANNKLKKFDANLKAVYNGIDQMFKLLKCNSTPILDLLGDQSHVNKYNVMMYLTLIEKRTTELTKQIYYIERLALMEKMRKGVKAAPPPPEIIRPDDKQRYKMNDITFLVPTQPCPLCVEQELVSDVIDTLQFAQEPVEVKDKLLARLQLPHAFDRLHNVSACHLPQSRRIIQQRYQ